MRITRMDLRWMKNREREREREMRKFEYILNYMYAMPPQLKPTNLTTQQGPLLSDLKICVWLIELCDESFDLDIYLEDI